MDDSSPSYHVGDEFFSSGISSKAAATADDAAAHAATVAPVPLGQMERCRVRLEDAAFSPALGNVVRLKYKEYLRCGFGWHSLHFHTS